MNVFIKIVAWILGSLFVLTVSLFLYLRYADLGRHKELIESFITDRVGHKVEIEGTLHINIDEEVLISAENIVVSNNSWTGDPVILTLSGLSSAIDAWSLYEGSVVFRSISLRDIDIRFATTTGGRSNWDVEDDNAETGSSDSSKLVAVQFNELAVENLAFSQTQVNFAQVSDETSESVSHDALSLDMRGRLTGTVAVEVGDKIAATISLNSPSLELERTVRQAPAADEPDSDDQQLLISDSPLKTNWLTAADIELDVDVDRLRINQTDIADFRIDGSLKDGGLSIDALSLRESDGSLVASVALTENDAGIDVDLSVDLEGIRVGAAAEDDEDGQSLPALGGSVEFSGRGPSLHQIMMSSSGQFSFDLGPGQVQNFDSSRLFGDMIVQTFRALNPLSEEQSTTNIACATFSANIENGLAAIEDTGIQTDNMTIVSEGSVNFENEALDLDVRAKPREGLGISLGGVANSFVRLGGTLAQPQLELDAAASMTTTGAAVATGGLSLVARGLLDRLTAESDLCSPSDDVVDP